MFRIKGRATDGAPVAQNARFEPLGPVFAARIIKKTPEHNGSRLYLIELQARSPSKPRFLSSLSRTNVASAFLDIGNLEQNKTVIIGRVKFFVIRPIAILGSIQSELLCEIDEMTTTADNGLLQMVVFSTLLRCLLKFCSNHDIWHLIIARPRGLRWYDGFLKLAGFKKCMHLPTPKLCLTLMSPSIGPKARTGGRFLALDPQTDSGTVMSERDHDECPRLDMLHPTEGHNISHIERPTTHSVNQSHTSLLLKDIYGRPIWPKSRNIPTAARDQRSETGCFSSEMKVEETREEETEAMRMYRSRQAASKNNHRLDIATRIANVERELASFRCLDKRADAPGKTFSTPRAPVEKPSSPQSASHYCRPSQSHLQKAFIYALKKRARETEASDVTDHDVRSKRRSAKRESSVDRK
ncbi:hypothetical protein MMC28_010700 [Mycoblastus sanguinarius]|nr:hypothetical protein [Mycoblastus sanguinarius]